MKEFKTIQEAYEAGVNDGIKKAGVDFVEDYGCVSRCKVFAIEDSIRASKFPFAVDVNAVNGDLTPRAESLAMSKMGEGHDNWLNGVIVQFDLKFSNKAWVEAERYHFFDFVSSQSTMHKITGFDMGKAFNKYVDKRSIEVLNEKIDEYNRICDMILESSNVVEDAEKLEELEAMKKEAYLSILYNNPAGFELTARMTTNYRQLKTMYNQRKNHRLPEGREFCKWIESLPCSYFITGKKVTA